MMRPMFCMDSPATRPVPVLFFFAAVAACCYCAVVCIHTMSTRWFNQTFELSRASSQSKGIELVLNQKVGFIYASRTKQWIVRSKYYFQRVHEKNNNASLF